MLRSNQKYSKVLKKFKKYLLAISSTQYVCVKCTYDKNFRRDHRFWDEFCCFKSFQKDFSTVLLVLALFDSTRVMAAFVNRHVMGGHFLGGSCYFEAKSQYLQGAGKPYRLLRFGLKIKLLHNE